MSVFRWIFAVVVVGLVGIAAVGSLKPKEAPPVTVRTTPVQRATITSTVRAGGKLEPVRKVNVSSNITGILLDLPVGIGSVVKKGQYVGQIDTRRYNAIVAQQRAQLAAAEADIERQEADLTRARSIASRMGAAPARAFSLGEIETSRTNAAAGEAQLSALRSRAAAARAALRDAENNLAWATLRAPVDGTVLSLNHRVGERIRGSDFSEDVVLVLGTLNHMEVRIDVGEHDVVHIRPGQKATITIDAMPRLVLEGEVKDKGRDAIIKNAGTDNEVTNFPVWVSINRPPADALSGMSAQVTIATDTRADAVVVPIQAVTVRPRELPPPVLTEGPTVAGPGGERQMPAAPAERLQKVVFVVKNDKVEKRAVDVGISSESQIEVVRGIAAGEEVVEGPYRTLARELRDGMKISVEKPEGKGGPGEARAAPPPGAGR